MKKYKLELTKVEISHLARIVLCDVYMLKSEKCKTNFMKEQTESLKRINKKIEKIYSTNKLKKELLKIFR